jgi:hypothetical protein
LRPPRDGEATDPLRDDDHRLLAAQQHIVELDRPAPAMRLAVQIEFERVGGEMPTQLVAKGTVAARRYREQFGLIGDGRGMNRQSHRTSSTQEGRNAPNRTRSVSLRLSR